MTFISSIIVAVDGSAPSAAAMARAITIAGKLGVELHLVHVKQKPATWDECESDIREEVEKLAIEAGRHGVYTTTDIREGDILECLKEAAHDHAAGMLVLGTRGHGQVHRLVVGSVAEKAMREIEIPVLVVGESLTAARAPIEKILFASDFSDTADDALSLSLDLAKRLGASLEVVHVVNPASEITGPYGVPASSTAIAGRDREVALQLEKTREAMANAGVDGTTDVLRGSEESAIADRASETGSGLVVVGATSHTRFTHALRGHLAYQTLLAGSCSVLVANGPRT